MANPARFAADLASKMASDPRIMRVILDNADGIRAASPDLAMRLDDGDPNAVLEAYQMIVAGGGRVSAGPTAADAADFQAPAPYDGWGPAADADLAARLGGSAPPRQLDLNFGSDPGSGLVPYGVRGPGVPVGGPMGSGVRVPPPTSLSPYVTPRLGLPEPPRGLPEPPRGLPEPPRGPPAPQRGLIVSEGAPSPQLRLESPDVVAERRAMEDLFDAVDADAAPRTSSGGGSLGFHARNYASGLRGDLDRARQIAADVIRRSAIPAAAAGIGAAAWSLLPDEAEAPNVDAAEPAPRMVPNVMRKPQAFSTADLAAETAPPPSVAVEDESITLDYAQMARDKIRQANEIQLREGRITPESAALTREADALYQKAAEARRTGFHPPIMPVEQQNEQTSAIRARQRRAG